MEQSTTVLLGLLGVAVQRVEVESDGTRFVHVVTADPDAAACPSCRVVSTSGKQHVTTRPKDLPYGAVPLRVVWHKRRWRCQHTDCATVTFTESIPQIPSRMRTTGRLRSAAAHAVADNRSVAEVAASHGVSWPTVQRAVDAHVDVVFAEPVPTPILGVDARHPARLGDFYTWCASTDILEIHRLATTVETWWPEILRFLETNLSNAKTEGTNRLIKDVGRRACGFRNPTNHRRRVRLICTRQSRRATARSKRVPD